MRTETAAPTKEKYRGTELTTHTFGDITLRGFMDDKDNPFFVAADVANGRNTARRTSVWSDPTDSAILTRKVFTAMLG